MYELLDKLCKQKNTTVSALCALVTKSTGNLATWKKGYMRSDYLSKCADFLGVSVDYLLGRSSPALAPDEQQLVEAFRACPENDKQYLLDTVILYANRAKTNINVEVT